MDIAAWLSELGLERYAEAFRDNDIDARILHTLSADDLRELGVASLGHRKQLLDAIARMGGAEPTVETDSFGTPRTRPAAERRQLTVMFCDLVGSTKLSARLDPEDMGAVIRSYQECCAEGVKQWVGHVAKYMGDGVLAYFGYPRAHEDEAERAVRAGLAIVEAVAALDTPAGAPLAARVGIATGLVMVGELIGEGAAQEQTVVGETPNLAARLQTLAAPGSVVISQATRRLLGGLFELTDLGPQRLKGFAEALSAWRVEGEGGAEGRFDALRGEHLTPLVGREHELGILAERWAWAKDGDGQVVLLSGEPGIGKSRLTRSLIERLADEPHIRLRYFCSPYHTNSALYPAIDQLERAAGFQTEDTADIRLDKLEAVLAQATEGVAAVAPLIGALLSVPTGGRYPSVNLTPEAQKLRTFEALVGQMEGLAGQRPVLMVLEDAHWIDPTSLELFGLVIDRIQHLRVLLLITYRPEFTSPWTGHAHVTSLTLSRLGQRQGAQMVERLTDKKPLPAEVLHQILLKTDGVPLFVEELTKTVLESGLLTDAGDHWELSGPLPPLAIPTTLHDSLMARLDRLAPVKEVAQIGAAIGREFSHGLLAAVAPISANALGDALDQLVSSELVFRRGTPPEATYSFKHALVQDAAYQSLLKSKRQQLHARIAEVLEQRFPETASTQPEVLARHYTAAGITEIGAHYWERAGARANERSAFVEAIHHYESGLELLRTLADGQERDRLELSLRMGLGDALSWTRSFAAAEVETAYNRAHALARQMGETLELFQILWVLWHFFLVRADMAKAFQLSNEIAQLGRRLNDPSLAPHVHRTLSETFLWRGEFAAAAREASACLDRPALSPRQIPGVQDPLVMCGTWQALALWHLGYPDQALGSADATLARAQGTAHAGDLGAALLFAGWIRVLSRETKGARTLLEESVRFNAEHGLALHVAISDVLLGSALHTEAHDEAGLTKMRDGLERHSASGACVQQSCFLTLLAAALGQHGDSATGLAALAEAESHVSHGGERWAEAEIHRRRGELLWLTGEAEEAEQAIRRSIEVARRQQAKSLELRAARDLARLWAEQGERQKAHDLLAPVYGWFTEGFDTADLKDAKALLDALT